MEFKALDLYYLLKQDPQREFTLEVIATRLRTTETHAKRLATTLHVNKFVIVRGGRYRYNKNAPAAPPEPRKRQTCMMGDCSNTFFREHPGHRVCNNCKKRDSWRNGFTTYGTGQN